jgi:hypothetical protein
MSTNSVHHRQLDQLGTSLSDLAKDPAPPSSQKAFLPPTRR